MLRLAALILILFTSVTAQAEWWQTAPQSARDTIRAVYERNRDYDMGYTLAAFCAIESGGGRWLLATGGKERSGGFYHLNGLFVAAWELGIPAGSVTAWQIDRILERLQKDRKFDDRHARAKIEELYSQHGGDWRMVWRAWNSRRRGQSAEVRAFINFFIYTLKWGE